VRFLNVPLFFVDADCDHVLGSSAPRNVVITDGRDLESYGVSRPCIGKIVTAGLGIEESEANLYYDCLIKVTRPIGILRILSARRELNLPFTATLDDRFARYILGSSTGASLDRLKLLRALLQNRGTSLTNLGDYTALWDSEYSDLGGLADFLVVHGKDFCRAIAWLLEIPERAAEAMLFLSMDLNEIRSLPNIRMTERWVRQLESGC